LLLLFKTLKQFFHYINPLRPNERKACKKDDSKDTGTRK